MEHIVDFVCFAPMVQILDAPVQQTVELLPDVLQFLGSLTTDLEQVIEVPKILSEASSGQVVDWVSCWRVPTVQTVQKTGETPQVLFLDMVVMPVVVQQ